MGGDRRGDRASLKLGPRVHLRRYVTKCQGNRPESHTGFGEKEGRKDTCHVLFLLVEGWEDQTPKLVQQARCRKPFSTGTLLTEHCVRWCEPQCNHGTVFLYILTFLPSFFLGLVEFAVLSQVWNPGGHLLDGLADISAGDVL